MASRSEAPKRSSEAQAIDGLPVIRYNVAGIDWEAKSIGYAHAVKRTAAGK